MSADAAQREPTMEEILASIRRIISEEDGQGGKGAEVLSLEPEAAPEPASFDEAEFEAEPPPPPPPPAKAAAAPAPVDDLMVMDAEPEPEFEPQPEFSAPSPRPQPQRAAPVSDDALISEPTARQAAGAIGRLMGSMMVSSHTTLDDVLRELMKPMLKDWLDANLPQIVESEVAREIERIRRMAR